MIAKILTGSIIAVSAIAGIAFYCSGDFKLGTYWVAAALVNYSATFL